MSETEQKLSWYFRNKERSLAYTKAWKKAHKGRAAELVRLSRARDPFKSRARILLWSAKDRARKRGVPFALTLADIHEMLQPRVCSVSGLPLDFTVNAGTLPWNPSLDCIVRSKGYVKGNVRITCYMVNVALNRFTDSELLTMCRAIVVRHNTSGHDNGN